MVHEKWFISDTHFFHENIIQYCGRPFANAELMNECLVENWNKVVGPNDYVYHLGDVACGYGGDERALAKVLFSLNGKKRLIIGNHDHLKSPALNKAFEKIELWKGRKEWGFTMSHLPLKEGHFRDGEYNVHGHVHRNHIHDVHYINVCVEVRNYTPVHLDTILAEIKEAKEILNAK